MAIQKRAGEPDAESHFATLCQSRAAKPARWGRISANKSTKACPCSWHEHEHEEEEEESAKVHCAIGLCLQFLACLLFSSFSPALMVALKHWAPARRCRRLARFYKQLQAAPNHNKMQLLLARGKGAQSLAAAAVVVARNTDTQKGQTSEEFPSPPTFIWTDVASLTLKLI